MANDNNPNSKNSGGNGGDALSKVTERIHGSKNVLIALSRNPSIDELTAALGLSFILDKIGKRVTAIFSGKIPDIISFLEPEKTFEKNTDSLQDFIISLDKEKADHIRYKVDGDFVKVFITPYKTTISQKDMEFSHGDFNVDLVISLNVPNENELDGALVEYGRIMHDASSINIMASAPSEFGDIKWGDPHASSICEMICVLANDLQDPEDPILDKNVSTVLLTGIIAATNRFSNERTTPDTMGVASRLMGEGADQQLIARNVPVDIMTQGEGYGPKRNDRSNNEHSDGEQRDANESQNINENQDFSEHQPNKNNRQDNDKDDDPSNFAISHQDNSRDTNRPAPNSNLDRTAPNPEIDRAVADAVQQATDRKAEADAKTKKEQEEKRARDEARVEKQRNERDAVMEKVRAERRQNQGQNQNQNQNQNREQGQNREQKQRRKQAPAQTQAQAQTKDQTQSQTRGDENVANPVAASPAPAPGLEIAPSPAPEPIVAPEATIAPEVAPTANPEPIEQNQQLQNFAGSTHRVIQASNDMVRPPEPPRDYARMITNELDNSGANTDFVPASVDDTPTLSSEQGSLLPPPPAPSVDNIMPPELPPENITPVDYSTPTEAPVENSAVNAPVENAPIEVPTEAPTEPPIVEASVSNTQAPGAPVSNVSITEAPTAKASAPEMPTPETTVAEAPVVEAAPAQKIPTAYDIVKSLQEERASKANDANANTQSAPVMPSVKIPPQMMAGMATSAPNMTPVPKPQTAEVAQSSVAQATPVQATTPEVVTAQPASSPVAQAPVLVAPQTPPASSNPQDNPGSFHIPGM